ARYCYIKQPIEVKLPGTGAAVTLEPKLGGWLTGHVMLPARVPAGFDAAALAEVDAVLVGWSMGGDNHSLSARLAPDLSFSAGGLRAGLNYFLTIDPRVMVPVIDAELTAREGEHVHKTYTLAAGARVRGKVTLPDGTPAKGAQVRASGGSGGGMDWLRGALGRTQVTGADGAFDLAGIAPGKPDLSAALDGYVDHVREDFELAEGELVENVVLALGAGNTVSGVVLWPDRTPVADATVRVAPAERENPQQSIRSAVRGGFRGVQRAVAGEGEHAKTDEQGRFALSGISAKSVLVTASKGKAIGEFPAQWRAKAGPVDALSPLELVLEQPAPLRGVVLDAAGKALETFRVTAAPAREDDAGRGAPTMGEDFAALFRSDSDAVAFSGRVDGSFTVYVEKGSYDVRVEAQGFTRSDARRVVAPSADVHEFRLARTCEITGVVLAPTGAPVAGAKVTHSQSSGRGLFGRTGGKSATADSEGRFAIEDVPAGMAALTATSEAWAPSEELEVTVDALLGARDVTLQLRVGGRLEGEIYDSTGRPDPDRQIMIGNFGPGGGDVGGNTKSDANGRFVAERIAPGSYNVMAMPRMNTLANAAGADGEFDVAGMMAQLKMTAVEIVDAQTTHVVLGAPPANPVRLTGRVLQGERGLEQGLVMAFADGTTMLSSMKTAKIGPDGSYAMVLDSAGDYSIVVGARLGDPDSTEFQESIPEVSEHRLDLELPAGAIRGRVLGPDGAPAANVALSSEREGRATIFAFDMGRGAQTAEDGSFQLLNLRPGTYTLRVGNSGFAGAFGQSARFGTAVVTGIELAKGQSRNDIVVRLDAPCAIEGTVRAGDGVPISGAAVFVRDAAGRVINPLSSCMTNTDGRFTFDGASPGTYTLSARRERQTTRESGAVRASSGETNSVELVMESGTMLKVAVEDAQGKPVRASIRVVDELGREHGNLMSAESFRTMFTEGFSSTEQKLGPLPPGKYRVTATDDAGKSDSKPLSLSGQPERNLRIKLD
ncbi:MAG: carboxypeptidase regulatory-like domain-containing protein, partial [Planctomycetes bacterium]|nr:carboxypeptidase regulatory-like domain-containing protein [Planctomycetota bacterium]